MNSIHRVVSHARRLLWLQIILNILSWSLMIAFAIAFLGMLVPKVWYVPYKFASLSAMSWSSAWLIGATVGATVVTAVIAMLHRPSTLYSAIELDRRFKMRERVSSTLQLSEEERSSSIGAALIDDTTTKVERVDVRDQFVVRPAPQTPWVMLPILACIALFWVPDVELDASKQLANNPEKSPVVANVAKTLRTVVEKQRKEAEEKGLEEMAEILRNVERKISELQKSESADPKKMLSDLNEIKKELEQRKQSLGDTAGLKQAFEGMKKMDNGPAEKMADALKEGDFKKAGDELEKMLESMRKGDMSAEQQQQLAKQLAQMEKAIDKAVDKIEQAKAEAKAELAQAEQAGDVQQAAKLRQKLEQLEAAGKQMKAAQSVKAKMQKAQEAMAKGDKQAAQEALEEMQGELGELAQQQENADELSDMIDQIQNSKNASNCDKCNGQGCANCNGKKRGDKPGNGKTGEGPGFGDRDESETATKDFNAQVRDDMRKGETIFGGPASGKNRKGITKESVHDAILNAKPDDPEAIENISLPKSQRDQQREYFDTIRVKQ